MLSVSQNVGMSFSQNVGMSFSQKLSFSQNVGMSDSHSEHMMWQCFHAQKCNKADSNLPNHTSLCILMCHLRQLVSMTVHVCHQVLFTTCFLCHVSLSGDVSRSAARPELTLGDSFYNLRHWRTPFIIKHQTCMQGGVWPADSSRFLRKSTTKVSNSYIVREKRLPVFQWAQICQVFLEKFP